MMAPITKQKHCMTASDCAASGARLGRQLAARAGRYQAVELLEDLCRAAASDPTWPAMIRDHLADVPGFGDEPPDEKVTCDCAGEDEDCRRCGGDGSVSRAPHEFCDGCDGLSELEDGSRCPGCGGDGIVPLRQ